MREALVEDAITGNELRIKDQTLYVQAGCGVVADSDPEYEYQETVNKAKALVRAAEEAEAFAGNNS